MDIKVPPIGEGIDHGTVVSILVKVGDVIRKDQDIIELETKKAVAPIPSTGAGKVSQIMVKVGDDVAIGQLVLLLDGAAGAGAPATPATEPEKKVAAPSKAKPVNHAPQRAPDVQPVSANYQYQSESGNAPPASPTVRKVARDLGLDLGRIQGTESGGRICMEDMHNYVMWLQEQVFMRKDVAPNAVAPKAPSKSIDFSKWGTVTKKPLSGLRKIIAERMTENWQTIPHVTQFDEADVTALMELRKKFMPDYEKKGTKLTLTPFIIKAIIKALQKYPQFNSSLDESTKEVVVKDYIHIGVAVDTDAGLIVPVIQNADKMSLLEMSLELADLSEKTKNRKVPMDKLEGGTFTISNLGGIGGTFFTPIINKPEVAILGIGKGFQKPIVKAGKVEVASVMPLGLSYDHRVIDGADGARFIREIIAHLESFNVEEVKI